MPFLIPLAIVAGEALATAAFVVSDVLVPLALGAIGVSGASLAAASAFAFAATTTIAETAALAGISSLLAPHPNVNAAGSPQAFKPNPNAGLPVVMGRYGVGGNLVYQTTSGGGNKTEAGAKGNEYLTSFVILSALGPVQAFETLRFNDTILTFDPNGQACNGGYIPYDEVQEWNPGYRTQNANGSYVNNNYQDRAWQNLQLGALNAGYFAPPDKITSDNAGLPEWTQAHGFSSFAASALTLVYDQRYYAGGVPQFQWVLQGVKTYDPRLDSTYPGGNGPQRWAGEGASPAAILDARSTWTFSQNPLIHALNYALGHFLPDNQTGLGRLYAGIGAGPVGVDVAAFVRAANVADANTWLICGQWTTDDGKWSVLTEMLKAGSATPVIDCGVISCIVDQPLTSLGTVTADDLSGPITLPTGSSFSARLNTIFPRYTSEAHRWQMVQADTPVKAATYVAEDGAVRSKTLDWQYVPAVNQACQLAAYAITNGREIPGINLPGKPKLRNYKVGDCLTLDIPEAGLATTKVMVTKRVTDQYSGGVTLTVRTETDAKHLYSLGVSGVAPATPGISGFDPTIVEAPLPDFWATGALEVTDTTTGESRVVVRVTGSADDNVYAQTVVLRWRPVALVGGNYTPTGDQSWSYRSFPASQGQFDLDLNPGVYDVQIAYITVNGAYPVADEDWLDLGIETVGGSTASNAAALGGTSAPTLFQQIAAAAAAVTLLMGNIGTANANIAALTTTYGDTASAAASSQASQAASNAALTAQGAAQAAAVQAVTAQGGASAAQTAAQGALTSAQQQATSAANSANLAALSVTGASGSASAAAGSATAASSSATSAGQSATSATGSANTATTQASNSATSATASSSSASAAASSAMSAGQSASSAQTSATTATTQAGNASSSATASAGSASSAQGYANTASTQATNAANSATTTAGSAGAASTSASNASSSATQAATSSSASQSASVQATATAAALLPSGFGLATVWSPTGNFPNAGYAANDPHFIAASDGAQVFRTDTSAVNQIVSLGQVTPVVGRTYRVTCVGRFVSTPASGPGSKLYADILGETSSGSVASIASAGVDNTGLGAGTLITTTASYTYTGSTTYSAIKVRALANLSNNGLSPYSTATYDVISLLFEDITQTIAATAQATAAASSATSAASSQTAASQSASSAATSATNANTSAGNASTSAGQASTSATNAAGSSNTAGTFATNASNSAGAAGDSANAANTSASSASTSASSASGSASSAQSYSQSASTQAGNASNSAQSASGSAVSASNSAAAAQQSYNLAATVGSGAINSNPTFAAYAGTGSIPTGWADGGNATGCSYANSGFDSPNCIGFTCTASPYSTGAVTLNQMPKTSGANYGLSFAGPGWYVLELDVYVHSQSNIYSAGVNVITYASASGSGTQAVPWSTYIGATPDINQATGIVTGRRQYANLFQITSAGSLGLSLAANGCAGNYGSSNIEWHKVLLRPASAAEIAGNQALISSNTNAATISSFQSAQTSQNSSFSTSLSTLNAAVFTASGGSLQSQISGLSATQATQSSTFASQISTLQSQVTIGQNLVGDGGLLNGGAGWAVKPQSVYLQVGFPGLLGYSSVTASGISQETGRFGVSAGSSFTATGNIQASLVSGSGTVTCSLNAAFFNSAGTNLNADQSSGQKAYGLSVGAPNATLTFTAPSGATTACLYVYTTITGGSSPNVTQYVSRLKCEAGSLYTGWSDDASGITLSASVTSTAQTVAALQGQLFASYTLTATAGNVITGLQLLSASGATAISAVVFQAENFLIKSSAAASTFSPFAYNSSTGTLVVQNVQINGNLIVLGTITSPQLALGSVSVFYYTYSNATTSIYVAGSSSPPPPTPPSGGGGSGSGGRGVTP